MKRIAILMTVFNRKKTTLQCLDSLKKLKLPEGYSYEVFLTNDGCTDGTPEAVKKNFPEVRIINGDGSLFWNRGMRAAWEEAAKDDFDYYLWLNDDVIVYPKLFDVLIKCSEQLANKAILCGPVEDSAHTGMTYGGELKWKKFVSPDGTLMKIDYSQGNIVLIPRFAFQKVGFNDSYYRHSKGDSDYGLMASKLGVSYYQTPCYLGSCELHSELGKCYNPDFCIRDRWKAFNRPNGSPLNETWYYWKKHRGTFWAFYECFKTIIRVLFPQIWTKSGHATLQ